MLGWLTIPNAKNTNMGNLEMGTSTDIQLGQRKTLEPQKSWHVLKTFEENFYLFTDPT